MADSQTSTVTVASVVQALESERQIILRNAKRLAEAQEKVLQAAELKMHGLHWRALKVLDEAANLESKVLDSDELTDPLFATWKDEEEQTRAMSGAGAEDDAESEAAE